MKNLEKRIWEFDDILTPEMSNYIEKLCIYYTPYFLRKGAFGTSELTKLDIKKNSLDDLHEYMQFTSVVVNNITNGPTEALKDLDVTLPFLLPMYNALSKMNLITSFHNILRCKLNLQPRDSNNSEGKYNRPHTDFVGFDQQEILTMIYYVNDSDGDTFFFNEEKSFNIEDLKNLTVAKRVKPKKGKLVAFRGDIVHSGSHPIKSDFRIAINYNLRVDDMIPS